MLRRLVRILALLAAAPLVALLSLALLLSLPAGQEWLAARVEALVNGAISGHVEVKRISLRPDGIRLVEVEISDPDGARVIEAKRLHVTPALGLGLLAGRVRVYDASIEGAKVLVETPADGGAPGIARAFFPRRSEVATAPPAADSQKSAASFLVEVDHLAIEDGSLVVRQAGAAPTVDFHGLSLQVSGTVDPDGVSARGEASAQLVAPVRGDAHLEVEGSLLGEYTRIEVRRLAARLGGSTANLQGTGSLDDLAAEIPSLEVRLLPDDVAGIVPAWKPTVPLEARGSATFASGTLKTRLSVAEGRGTLDLDAELQPIAGSWKLSAKGRDLDPKGFDTRAPAADLDLNAELLGATWLEPEGTIEIPRATLGKGSAGPIRIEGALREGRLELHSGRAEAPGGSISLRGWIGEGTGDLRFDLRAADLQRLLASAQALGKGAGVSMPELPPLAGPLQADGRIDGGFDRSRIDAQLRSGALAVGGAKLHELFASLRLEGLPAAPHGAVKLRSSRLEAGSAHVEAITADLRLEKGRIAGGVEGRGALGRMQASLDAAVAPGFSQLRFDRLELSWPRARWTLRRPALLDLRSAVAIRDVALESDDGATIDGDATFGPGAKLGVDAAIRSLDLARIPAELAPAELGLGGRVDLDAKLSGTTSAPRGTLTARLIDGAFAGASGVAGDAELKLTGTRVEGTIHATRDGTSMEASGELPWPLQERAAAKVRASVRGLDLAEASRLLALASPLEGRIDLDADLGGSLAAPAGTIRLHGVELGAEGISGAGAEATALLAEKSIVIESEATLGDSHARAHLEIERAPGSLLGADDLRERLLAAPLRGTLEATAIDLGRFDRLRDVPPAERVRGRVDLKASVAGTVGAPRGVADLALHDAWSGGIGPIDAEVHLDAGEKATTATLASRLLGRRFLTGTASLGAPVEGFHAWEKAPLEARFAADDLELGSLTWPLGIRKQVAGKLAGTFSVDGTGAAPKAVLALRGTGIAVGAVAWGSLAADARYADGRLDAGALLQDATGGEARLDGRWKVDLGAAAIADGSLATLASAPLDAQLDARSLDLEFLETISNDLRQAGGKLDAKLAVRGRFPLPTLDGIVAVRDGRLSYTGYGDVRDISAALELSPNELRIRRLEAHAGGSLVARGAATRKAEGNPFDLDLTLEARRFAVVSSDLTRAWLDADARLGGTLSSDGFEGKLEILRANAELPDSPGKNIQGLDGHPDFVVIAGNEKQLPARLRTEKKSRGGGMDLTLAIESQKPVRVQGTDVSLDANVDLRLLLVDGELAMAGKVEVPRGHVLVLNRRFELNRGRVTFVATSPPNDPRLDLRAIHESSTATVTVTVGGTAQRPITNLRSNPPMSEAQIATLLATGRTQLKGGAGGMSEASGAASALGAVVASQLKKGIASKLPVDVISFETGDEGFEGSRLEAGTYVTERIYVGYARRFEGAQTDPTQIRNANEVRVEYQLAPRWTLEVTYGDANVGGADLFWTRDF